MGTYRDSEHKKKLRELLVNDHKFLQWHCKVFGRSIEEVYVIYQGGRKNQPALEEHIRSTVTDNDRYVAIMQRVFTTADLNEIERNKTGGGLIGGKAAGMLLAFTALKPYLHRFDFKIAIPESWFIGGSTFDHFLELNKLERYQRAKFEKYLWRENYEQFLRELPTARLDSKTERSIRKLLAETAGEPLVIRSSSLLEDGFSTPFAGLYDSYFIPNSFTPEENFKMFTDAVKAIYASVYKPDALAHRAKHRIRKGDEVIDLLHEFEAMALLVQRVVGKEVVIDGHRYFMPVFSGVGLSQNQFPASNSIPVEDGAANLALGLGTFVVDKNQPTLYSDLAGGYLRMDEEYLKASQKNADVIDLEEKVLGSVVKELPVADIVKFAAKELPGLERIVSVDEGRGLKSYSDRKGRMFLDKGHPFVTFHALTGKDRVLSRNLRNLLKIVEFTYAKDHVVQLLHDRKMETVGEVIDKCPDNVRDGLRADSLLAFNPDEIERHLPDDPQMCRDVVGKLSIAVEAKRLLLNMDDFFKFEQVMAKMTSPLKQQVLSKLAEYAIDCEFASIGDTLYVVQARPQLAYDTARLDRTLDEIPVENRLIEAEAFVNNQITGIRYVIYVDADLYKALPHQAKGQLGNAIGRLNRSLEGPYILIAPGRLGSRDCDLGVPLKYHQLNNAKMLFEYQAPSMRVDPSYGSHFPLLLIADNIFYAPIRECDAFRPEMLVNEIGREFDGALRIFEQPVGVYMQRTPERRLIVETTRG